MLALSQGALRFRPGRRDRRLIGERTFGEIGGTVCFLTALFNMPIANATAILQSLPLAVTLAAALLFDEPVGWRRYLAIAVGFPRRPDHRAAGLRGLQRLRAAGRSRRSSSSCCATSRPAGCRRTCRRAFVAFVTSVVLTVAAAAAAGRDRLAAVRGPRTC